MIKFNTSFIESFINDVNFKNILEDNKKKYGEYFSNKFGFIEELKDDSYRDNSRKIFNKFKNKKVFVQVGIGGSSLGPKMLVSALNKSTTQFIFLNNIDPDEINNQLNNLNIEESLFYIVSKSGGTAETMAGFIIISNILFSAGVKLEDFNKYFVFATDPSKGQLRKLGIELNIDMLRIPSNVGGRFSVLTPVGFLPALFAGIEIDTLAKSALSYYLDEKTCDQIVIVSSIISKLKNDFDINQTVLMPYSSKLSDFSLWFVQLWAESLGKEKNKQGESKFIGLTPIPAYGATDQHAQMQLFMEGPIDKFMLLLNINKFNKDYSLKNDFSIESLRNLSGHNLSDLMSAEFSGTLDALSEKNRPYLSLNIESLNEETLGSLIMFFECLTGFQGELFNINPYDQPGVELGKIFAFKYLGQ